MASSYARTPSREQLSTGGLQSGTRPFDPGGGTALDKEEWLVQASTSCRCEDTG